MKSFPTGNVTFLFTDIEGSTRLAQKYPDILPKSLNKHNEILRDSIESNNGYIFQTVGDAFCCAFQNPVDAVKASHESQCRLLTEVWEQIEIKVRMGLNTGFAEFKNDNYLGYVTLAQTQRVMSAAYGGQILTTESTNNSVNLSDLNYISFKDLGERKLKDLIRPVRIYQLVSEKIPSEFPPIKTIDARPSNLPSQSSNFIGREKEISEINSLFLNSRLLTLTGPGGTGKTRLSIQIASGLVDEFENGVWFVELASVTGRDLITEEISAAINFKPDAQGEHFSDLLKFLKNKKLLIILDNCEHVINDCAFITEEILLKCPGVKILLSSRQVLNLTGEKIYKVPALLLPDSDFNYSAENVRQFESVRLFEDRARQVIPGYSITDDNAKTIAGICRRLDGIPLAIELAAARLKVIGAENILSKLNDRFSLLKSGSRTALPRQKTLRALIDWSYDLLDEKEKLLFQRLTVFSRGWNIDSAEDICSDENVSRYDIIELLSNLVDKSIISVNYNVPKIRYTMLETILEYGKEKLVSSGSESTFIRKHFDYYLNLCKEKSSSKGKNQIAIFKTIIAEFDNLRIAIYRALETDPSLALRLANEIGDIWELNGKISEGYEIFTRIFSEYSNPDESLKAQGYLNLSFLCSQTGRYDEAEKLLYESLEIFKKLNDTRNLGDCLNNIGNLYFLKDEMKKSEDAHKEALEIGYESNDHFLIGMSIVNLASINSYFGKFAEAIEMYEEGLKIFREFGDMITSSRILIQLGREEMNMGNPEKAGSYYDESIPVLKELDDHIPLIVSLLNLSYVSANKSNNEESLSLIEEALTLSKKFGYTSLLFHTYLRLGNYYISHNKHIEAFNALLSGLKICDPVTNKVKAASLLTKVITCMINFNELHKSVILYGAVLKIHEELNTEFNDSSNKNLIADLERVKTELETEVYDNLLNQGFEMEFSELIKLLTESHIKDPS